MLFLQWHIQSLTLFFKMKSLIDINTWLTFKLNFLKGQLLIKFAWEKKKKNPRSRDICSEWRNKSISLSPNWPSGRENTLEKAGKQQQKRSFWDQFFKETAKSQFPEPHCLYFQFLSPCTLVSLEQVSFFLKMSEWVLVAA